MWRKENRIHIGLWQIVCTDERAGKRNLPAFYWPICYDLLQKLSDKEHKVKWLTKNLSQSCLPICVLFLFVQHAIFSGDVTGGDLGAAVDKIYAELFNFRTKGKMEKKVKDRRTKSSSSGRDVDRRCVSAGGGLSAFAYNSPCKSGEVSCGYNCGQTELSVSISDNPFPWAKWQIFLQKSVLATCNLVIINVVSLKHFWGYVIIIIIMAYLLNARIVKPAETAVARQWLNKRDVKGATDTHSTTEESCWKRCFLCGPCQAYITRTSPNRVCRQAVSWELQKLLAEAGDSPGTQRKESIRC
jgi:hypothetical protein